MKRFLSIALVALLLVFSLAVISPTVLAETVSSTEKLTLTFGRDYSFSFEFGQEDTAWSDLVDTGSASDTYLVMDDQGYICFVDESIGLFYVYDQEHIRVHSDDSPAAISYTLELPVEFSFIEVDVNAKSESDKYTFSGLVPSLCLRDIIQNSVVFHNDFYGNCRFVYFDQPTGVVALTVGVTDTGYSDLLFLYSYMDYYGNMGIDAFIFDDMNLTSASYYGISVCGSDVHKYGSSSVLKTPTCTEKGLSLAVCEFCGARNEWTLTALGHDYDFLGRCKRDGCDSSILGSAGAAIGGFFEDVGGAVGGALNGAGSAIGGVMEDFNDTLNGNDEDQKNGGNTLVWILGLVLGIALLFLLWPLLKSLVDLIASGVKALVSGIKNLRNRSKSKKKKKS